MDYHGAISARQKMKVPCEILRVPKVCAFSLSTEISPFKKMLMSSTLYSKFKLSSLLTLLLLVAGWTLCVHGQRS